MHTINLFILLLLGIIFADTVNAGIVSYGICQTGCNTLGAACYASAGYTFGTVTAGAGTPAAILGCNVALGKCTGACIAVGYFPFFP
jgi:hypothetical protein